MDCGKVIFSFPKPFGNSSKKLLLIVLGLYIVSAMLLCFVDPFFHTHQYLKWAVVQEPTCISEGLLESRCYCGHVTTRWVPVGDHAYSPWVIDQLPTKTENGQRRRTCTVCGKSLQATMMATDPDKYGSAGWIGNNTVVVSIFASDRSTYWDPRLAQDEADKAQMLKQVKITTEWITQQCNRYDAHPQFYYDWIVDPELSYQYTFWDLDVSKGVTDYKTQREYIRMNIPSKALMDRYQAQNIIYLFFFDTDKTNTATSTGYFDNIKHYDLEILNLFTHKKSETLPSSLMALLMLRCFGAPPLWCESRKIPQAYIDVLKDQGTKSVMRSYHYGEWINQEITHMDAYYLGLLDSIPLDVVYYHMGSSDFHQVLP